MGLGVLGLFFAVPDFSRGGRLQAQEESRATERTELTERTEGTECTYFTNFPPYSARGPALLERLLPSEDRFLPSSDIGFRTQAVARSLPAVPDGPPAWSPSWADERLTWIDYYIFSALRAKGIAPANLTNDAEFLRRVTLDLTGRIPSTDEVTAFLADRDPQKRSHAIDRLLDSPEWVDRWTFWLGDLLKNNVRSTQVVRYNEGRDAFNQFIRDSLTENKPYNQFAAELIAATGDNFENGAVNFDVGGITTMGPVQDTYEIGRAHV